MGGQACVFYGAAEFSRDSDLVILADAENLRRLQAALSELHADCIAMPPFAAEFLERGHAIHFRCRRPEAAGMRVDVMSKLRGVDPFSDALALEERLERERDRLYWAPLKAELEQLRHQVPSPRSSLDLKPDNLMT
ncbi:MAG: hypothetical protein HZA90_14220 [Verrucomicrobia bacterium]|nr:hypothetical protein [Verrucomicrobiota bacterium]